MMNHMFVVEATTVVWVVIMTTTDVIVRDEEVALWAICPAKYMMERVKDIMEDTSYSDEDKLEIQKYFNYLKSIQ